MLMHQVTKCRRVPVFQSVLNVLTNLSYAIEVVEHNGISAFRSPLLIRQKLIGFTGISRKEHEEVLLKIVKCICGNQQWGRTHRPIARKVETCYPAERGYVLVLLANGPTEFVNLNGARLFCDRPGGHVLPLIRVESAQ
jgi:hypothetical protein